MPTLQLRHAADIALIIKPKLYLGQGGLFAASAENACELPEQPSYKHQKSAKKTAYSVGHTRFANISFVAFVSLAVDILIVFVISFEYTENVPVGNTVFVEDLIITAENILALTDSYQTVQNILSVVALEQYNVVDPQRTVDLFDNHLVLTVYQHGIHTGANRQPHNFSVSLQ